MRRQCFWHLLGDMGPLRQESRGAFWVCGGDCFEYYQSWDIAARYVGHPKILYVSCFGCTYDWHNSRSGSKLILNITPLSTHVHLAIDSTTIRVSEAHRFEIEVCQNSGLSNGSIPLLRVRVLVGTEPVPNCKSGLSIHPYRPSGCVPAESSLPVWIGRVLSRLSGRSICKYVQCACLCCLIMVLNENPVFGIQESNFASFAGCDIDNI